VYFSTQTELSLNEKKQSNALVSTVPFSWLQSRTFLTVLTALRFHQYQAKAQNPFNHVYQHYATL